MTLVMTEIILIMGRNFKRRSLRWIVTVCIFVLVFHPLSGILPVQAQSANTAQQNAQELLASLSPEERVGQLFLVTFPGTKVDEGTQIHDLIVNHHIGGVVLLAANDNIQAGENSLPDLLSMNRQLQLNRWSLTQQPQTTPEATQPPPLHYIPLFIGTSQEGDSAPYDQILYGVTKLPNGMALGATWNPDMARQVGAVLGNELSALGINLLMGPSLDVLETPSAESSSDLGSRTFGGDPFWVGEMGSAYITGVHQGSQGRIATIAQHFPGNGGADRSIEEEVATVRKSLDQLKKIDLVPFFAVTGDAPSTEATTDGLLASHIRYQGFQENIRATTRPVSFDPQAFNQLMSLEPLVSWREAGGVMVSDNLGSRAVRSFYELTGQVFEARRVALNAFLAGNDLLYLGDMTSSNDPDSYTAILRTLDFFNQKYREDPAFAQRVDESVLRLLTLKYRLYPVFNLENTLPPLDGIETLGTSSQVSTDVANSSATLISPLMTDLDVTIPDPPNQTDRIVFITDERTAKQCSTCPEESIFPVDGMEQAVLRLYGPQAGSQVLPFNLISYSNEELLQMLNVPRGSTQLEIDLRRAQWIVFAMANVSKGDPVSQALTRFLAERPDLFQQKRLIVFAFNAPYYLDATDISKLTAYYGLYSKIPNFVDVAARLLFRELTPTGVLPVSVPGVGYDLITATSPDPNQIIPLMLQQETDQPVDQSGTPVPVPTPELRVGSTIAVQTGVILDHNGHQVPDGTPAQFIVTTEGVVSTFPQIETTVGGIARTSIQVTSAGALEIRVESEPAKQSEVLRFDIPQENGTQIPATATQPPPETPDLTPTATIPPQVIIVTPQPPSQQNHLSLVDWLVATLLAAGIAFISYRLSAFIGQVQWGVRGAFFALIGGLVGYCSLAITLHNSQQMIESLGGWGVIFFTAAGSALGLLVNWVWRAATKSRAGEA
jgi:beta-N-acetylhexosaminidase